MDIVFLVVLGSLIMVVLAISVTVFVTLYQKKVIANKHEMQVAENNFQIKLIEATIISEQNEREKIAKNLHDDLGSSLTTLKLNFERLGKNTPADTDAAQLLTKSSLLITQAIHDLRRISRDLMPETLIRFGFINSLCDFCAQLSSSGFRIDCLPLDKPIFLSQQSEVQLYYISRELINNIIKHSGASEMRITFSIEDKFFHISYEYNGNGISNEDVIALYAQQKGIGLKNIESRLRVIGGKINYLKFNSASSAINITVPIGEKN